MAVIINQGTQTTIQTASVGGTETGVVRLDVGSGTTTAEFGGTVRDIANLSKGTITRIENGTITPLGTNSSGLLDTTTWGSILDGGAVKVKFTDGASILTASPVGVGNNATNPGIIAVGVYGQRIDTPLTFTDGRYAAFRLTEQRELMVAPSTGTQQTLGTVGTVNGAGTVTNLGSVTNIGVIHNAGTIAALAIGTISKLPSDGTITQVTTVSTVSSVSNLVKGTITKVEGGTLAEITAVKNPTAGDLNATIFGYDGSTQRAISTDTGGQVKLASSGTILNLAAGTVRIDSRPVTSVLSHGTLGTAGGSFFATISAASGSGTRTFVTNVDIVMQSGTADVRVLAGSAIQGTGVIAAGFFPAPGGGIAAKFHPAFDAGDNSALLYHFVGAGTAFITVKYWKGV